MQVFIFGAARTKSFLSSDDSQLVLEKLIQGQRVLDWTLHGLNEAGIQDSNISFVGGYQVEKIIKEYPQLHYSINPRWEDTHVLGSLRYAMENWQRGDVLLMYADTIFRPVVFKEIIKSRDQVTIGVDRKWRDRIKSPGLQYQAEKILSTNGTAEKVGRYNISPEAADGQYSGLTFIKKEVAEKIQSLFTENRKSGTLIKDQDSLTDLLKRIKNKWGIPLSLFDHSGLWAELDSQEDLSKFIFGTKAETLERIRPFIKKSTITDQVHFRLKEWESEASSILNRIQNQFTGSSLIVRSSSLEEDSWDSSQAGAFLSVADIPMGNAVDLEKAVEDVIEGFKQNGSGKYNPDNQVLVQPFIKDVAMSGVAFSKHLENGTPYYLINYDDQSKRTDTVTSGTGSDSKTVVIYKEAESKPDDWRIVKIIEAVDELEVVTGYSSLDVEFVLTEDGELHIVQVRPITIQSHLNNVSDFRQRIDEAKSKVKSRCKNYPHIFGDITILADMPDWNPAEMIGVRPSPLAVSLYQYLITDSAWRNGRAKVGYYNPTPEKLMYCIGGHPYIDVRNSLNNLIPADLSPELSHKLVNHYLDRLRNNPQYHDKIEFEIAITCYTPDIENHTKRLVNSGFNRKEVDHLKIELLKLTENAITGSRFSVTDLIEQTEMLNPRRVSLLNTVYSNEDIPTLIQLLLDDCVELGTIPFSMLARYGFIASSMLKGFVARNVISEQQKNDFLNSIDTVAGELVQAMNGVQFGKISREEFLKEFGHLRPGTYDINSFNYREKPDYYFPKLDKTSENNDDCHRSNNKNFSFDKETLEAMETEIQHMGMNISVNQLLTFIREATAGREYAKFQFTKNIDAVLTLISEWGANFSFTKKDLSYLFLDDILRLNTHTLSREPVLYIKQKVQDGKTWFEESNRIETPQVITSTVDLDIIEYNVSEPNFVTSKIEMAPIYNLKNTATPEELKDKIILIEGADPGYDWIFLHPIKGLITKYGGAASHMTIRCAEFGLPAAIGCGEELYEKLKKATNVELNCGTRQIKVLG